MRRFLRLVPPLLTALSGDHIHDHREIEPTLGPPQTFIVGISTATLNSSILWRVSSS